MQPDSASRDKYSDELRLRDGRESEGADRHDTISWHDKAWVVGVSLNGESKAYDWKRLRRERALNDEVGGTPIVLALASDSVSFFAFERPDAAVAIFDARRFARDVRLARTRSVDRARRCA